MGEHLVSKNQHSVSLIGESAEKSFLCGEHQAYSTFDIFNNLYHVLFTGYLGLSVWYRQSVRVLRRVHG